MKSQYSPVKLVSLTLLIFVLAAAPLVRAGGHEKARSAAAFEKLISLVGEWEGTNSSGQVRATYTLGAGGHALMERLQSGSEPEMLTLYTLDGDHLMVTHYCSSGNQPQMKTAAITDLNGVLNFKVVSVSGMKAPDEGHMTGL